jgi:DNA polymerase-3 subunit epsilon
VDIETTGSHYGADCITEIGIVVTDGVKEIGRYETLVNPQARIPRFITHLTGITEAMVADAPTFDLVADEIMSFLEGRIFVAHNVNFDYKIVKAHMENLGMKMPSRRLCTVRLSRKIIPGYPSYSLGKLSNSLGFKHNNVHRAMGDAAVTAELFHLLIDKNDGQIEESLKGNSKESTLPANLPKSTFTKLPTFPGVYYFHNAKGKIIYIGKAKNIKKRISSHFTGKSNLEKGNFLSEIYDISHELTGNEVLATLLEDAEIKHYWPEYNRAQKSQIQKFGVYKYQVNDGSFRLGINKINTQYKGIMQFPTLSKARTWLLERIEEFELNASLCGMAAFDSHLIEEEEHNKNLKKFLSEFLANEETIVWHGRGRSNGERGFVLMERGIYQGFGYIDREEAVTSIEQLRPYLQQKHETWTVRKVLASSKLNNLRRLRLPN